jgi:outer membrane protein
MQSLAFFGTGLAVALGLAGAAAAQPADYAVPRAGSWIVDVRATGVMTNARDPIRTAAGAATGLSTVVGDDAVPTLGFTYFVTDNISVEAILGASQHKVRAKGGTTDVLVHKTWVLPPVVTVQYRPAPAARISPYVGAGANAMLFFGDKDYNGFGVDLKSGVGWALQAGVDVSLSGPWTLNLDAKKVWFDTTAKINGGALTSHVNLDPWVISAGFGRKF